MLGWAGAIIFPQGERWTRPPRCCHARRWIRRHDRRALPNFRGQPAADHHHNRYLPFLGDNPLAALFLVAMSFQEDRFEYTGRGGELFLGALMALGILIGLSVVAGLLSDALWQVHWVLGFLPMLALYLTFFILGAAARFSAQRYRLSRTLWCGIRGGMEGSALAYGLRSFLYTLLLPLTLLQLLPWTQIRLAEQRINASRMGNAAFSCSGRARAVYLPTWRRSLARLCCSRRSPPWSGRLSHPESCRFWGATAVIRGWPWRSSARCRS